MEATLSGMVTPVRLPQPKNASSPMKVTLSGMVTLVRLLQLKNAPCPIPVTPLPMTTLFMLYGYGGCSTSASGMTPLPEMVSRPVVPL